DVGTLAFRSGQLGPAGSRKRHDEVEPVEQRPRQLVAEAIEALRRAGAAGARIAAAATGAEVHRADELEPRRELTASRDPCNGDDPVLERLPQRLEDGARELRQLIEKQH